MDEGGGAIEGFVVLGAGLVGGEDDRVGLGGVGEILPAVLGDADAGDRERFLGGSPRLQLPLAEAREAIPPEFPPSNLPP